MATDGINECDFIHRDQADNVMIRSNMLITLTRFRAVLFSCAIFAGLSSNLFAQSKVIVRSTGNTHELLRNGKPFTVKGAGGTTHFDKLAAAGGNSIRTWSAENLDEILAAAQKHDLTVCVGMWLGHERHGFNYQDQAAVLSQLESCLNTVRKYKDHPAVLMWGIGNEMEGDGNNPAIWYAVNHIAREIKAIDPHHPTMTVIAELGERKVQNINRFCPNIDLIGINSYGGLSSLPERLAKTDNRKPYIVTEHGPLGPWEVEKTTWNTPLEPTSTKKAKRYADGYRKNAIDQKGNCLGSYAFLWGHKQETTATWFGMLLPDGTRLAAVDAMSEAWTGRPPKNRCPEIANLKTDAFGKLTPGEIVKARLSVSDPENDKLTVRWILRQDSGTIGVGGDFQSEEVAFKGAVKSQGIEATLTVPEGGGGYRLFAYAFDGQGGAAVANVPLYVDAPILAVKSPKAKLPLVVYADDLKKPPYTASGFMGNTKAVKMTEDSQDNPHSGKTCLQVDYEAANDWGGVLWQSPPNDWDGEKPGGFDITGAKALEFWARGKSGGEKVSFVLGVVDGNQLYRDTAKAELKDVVLTTRWKKYRMSLSGKDLTRIKTGFGWSLAGQGQPVTFYLDDIQYTAE